MWLGWLVSGCLVSPDARDRRLQELSSCPDATWFVDADGDGAGAEEQRGCAPRAGSADLGGDCDDADPDVRPGAEERACNGVDDDCDPDTRDEAPEAPGDGVDQDCDGREDCYLDIDGDGVGSGTLVTTDDLACAAANASPTAGDCDDTNAEAFPGAVEVPADAVDEDCDGTELCWEDRDADGFGTTTTPSDRLGCVADGLADLAGDCDDGDAGVFPGAAEGPADGVDQDCDGLEDCFLDHDEDGYGSAATVGSARLGCAAAGLATRSDDCDDDAPDVYPGAAEAPADGADEDCDGLELCWVDADGDGVGGTTASSSDLACAGHPPGGDCDDADPEVLPGADEVPGDGRDQDCDGAELCFRDEDRDGFGGEAVEAVSDLACDVAGVAPIAGDCDDQVRDVFPGAPEAPADGRDADCDGLERCYEDGDGDGWGVEVSRDLATCAALASVLPGDCDDGDPTVSPGAAEVAADFVDQDCDGLEACWEDLDGDLWGGAQVGSADLACAGLLTAGGDCDDGDPGVNPEVRERCDGVDQDCDGVPDQDAARIAYGADDLEVRRVDATGGTPEVWIPGTPGISTLQVVDGGAWVSTWTGLHFGDEAGLVLERATASGGQGIAVDSAGNVFLGEYYGNLVLRDPVGDTDDVVLSGADLRAALGAASTVGFGTGFALDEVGGRLFFHTRSNGDPSARRLMSIALDGTDLQDLSGPQEVQGVAWDPVEEWLYYGAELGRGSVQLYRMRRGGDENEIFAEVGVPGVVPNLAVDEVGRRLVVALYDPTAAEGSVHTFGLDGAHPQVIVSGLSQLQGVAVAPCAP